jgi:hypothetical protein
MIKIAYELAFLWLGEAYLDDRSAAELRAAIMDQDIASTDGVLGFVGYAQGCDAFNFWIPNRAHHLAYSTVINERSATGIIRRIAIAVRVFDIYAAVIPVTNEAAHYLRGVPDDLAMLRFVVIDAISGKMHNTHFQDEQHRLAAAMRATQRFPPFPDPLEP